MINSVLALGFDATSFNWSDLTPLTIEHKQLSPDISLHIDKAIDASISTVGIYASPDIVSSSALIGAFLTIDAASLLGKSAVGQDEQWINNVATLRDLLRISRTLKATPEEVITKTLGSTGFDAYNAIITSSMRETKTILVGPGAIALGFVAVRGNSKLKHNLLIANSSPIPSITEAINFMGSKVIMNSKENIHPLAELALAVSALKASEL